MEQKGTSFEVFNNYKLFIYERESIDILIIEKGKIQYVQEILTHFFLVIYDAKWVKTSWTYSTQI